MADRNRELLEWASDMVETLRRWSDAGGDSQLAFDLHADTRELEEVCQILDGFSWRVANELEPYGFEPGDVDELTEWHDFDPEC